MLSSDGLADNFESILNLSTIFPGLASSLDPDLALWWDFANSKSLAPESGLGPTLSIVRSTTATYFDADGVLQTALANTARFGHTPQTGAESFGLLSERSKTNRALHSSDLTNAAWVKVNATAAKDATGLDGNANSASTLTATGANGTCLQSFTLGSLQRTYSAFVRRKTGTGTVEMTDDNGANWTDITASINSSTYSRLKVTRTQANPVVGFRLGTSADKIEVDANQVEDAGFESSVIPTTTIAVTRADDDIDGDLSPTLSSGPIGVYFAVRSDAVGADGSAYAWQLQEAGGDSLPNWFAFSRGSIAARIDVDYRPSTGNPGDIELGTVSGMTAGQLHRLVATIDTNDYAGRLDAEPIDTDTACDIGVPNFNKIFMGNTSGGSHFDGFIADWRAYTRRLSTAEITSLAATGSL